MGLANKKLFDQIRFITGGVEGYGGPGYCWVKVVYKNLLLNYRKTDKYNLSRQVYKLQLRWRRIIRGGKFEEKIRGKEAASSLCSVCGGDTLDGGSWCVEKVFCTKCKDQIPKYREVYEKEREEYIRRHEIEREQKEQIKKDIEPQYS